MLPILFRLPEWLPVVGGAPITSFGVMMLLSFLVAGWVLRAELERMGEDADRAWDILFMAVVGGVVGAKVYYVLLNYPRLVADPMGMIFSRGGMVWYGGFLLATALVVWKVRNLGLPLGKVADGTALALPLAYAVGRIGCFLVGDDYGRPTDSWVGIAFPNGSPPTRAEVLEAQFGVVVDPALVAKYGEVLPVHPTQLYETGISILIFLILFRLRSHSYRKGWLFTTWMAMAGAERFLVEFFRAKDDRFFGVLTVAQVISLLLIVVGATWAISLRKGAAGPKPKDSAGPKPKGGPGPKPKGNAGPKRKGSARPSRRQGAGGGRKGRSAARG